MSETILRKPIPGFPGYEIDSTGAIYSFWKRRCLGRPKGTTHFIHTEPHALNPIETTLGYLMVNLKGPNGIVRNQLVHALVLKAFIGPCPDGMECRHLDGNQKNNRLENLKWGTATENAADRVRHGTALRGEAHPMAKLTSESVRTIRKQKTQGVGTQVIARIHGVSCTTIRRIVNGDMWGSVK